jgi:hypothetical protein
MKTRHEWLRSLEAVSPAIDAMHLTDTLPEDPYWDAVKKRSLNKHAFNFSHSSDHNNFLGRTIEALAAQQATPDQLNKLVTDLTSRSTYGTFTELAAYGVLIRQGVPFKIQIPAGANDILNPNGSELDGEIDGAVLFDSKAFGLQENLIDMLVERLGQDLAPDFVSAESSWNIPIRDLESLLGSSGYKALLQDLRSNRRGKRGPVEFNVRPPAPVQTSTIIMNPTDLANQTADYAFNYAKQFARLKPFVLVFVVHPWLGGLTFSTNFANYADTFMQAFAQNTFNGFLIDTTNQHFGVTRAAASKMLSGLLFIDAWQGTNPPTRDTMRLYLNSNADRPVPAATLSMLQRQAPQLYVEQV